MNRLHHQDAEVSLWCGDARKPLPLEEESVQCVVTSPPYWGLRDYGVQGQIGLEETLAEYVEQLVAVFREVHRVLRRDGTLWLNLGDSYAGSWGAQSRGEEYQGSLEGGSMLSARQIDAAPKRTGTGSLKRTPGCKNKDLIGIPWMVAVALRADGWYLRCDIVWHKPNPMPESVRDRPTKAHEYVFLLTKSEEYFYDHAAIREPFADERQGRTKPNGIDPSANGGRNRRSVWTVPTQPYAGAHFATFPPGLIEPCVLAGSRAGDLVLDPFNGAGTTGLVALQHGRRYAGRDINAAYLDMTVRRLAEVQRPLLLTGGAAS